MLTPNIDLNQARVLVTGAAGFIGSNLCRKLLEDYPQIQIWGVDSLNDYYDVNIKYERLKDLEANTRFHFQKLNIADAKGLEELFGANAFDVVVNLAAQAGVRYSITNPDAYIESNLVGFYNILQACRKFPVAHLVYASSSSVYGSNEKIPYSEQDKTDEPVSLYAATKKSNELLAHSYAKLYGIPMTGLRFFTVYGPAGRPDMAYFGFTNKLRNGQTIQIFNYGNCRRDFTYIDDIVKGVIRVMETAPAPNKKGVPFKVYNIGNNQPENLLEFVDILCKELIDAGVLPEDYDFDAHMELVGMQPGDVEVTYADVSALQEDFGFRPATPLQKGLHEFAKWYADYYGKQEVSEKEQEENQQEK